MIKYSRKLNVSASEFYSTMCEAIALDIKQQTGRELDGNKIQNGCKYKVKKKRGNKTIETIIEVKKPILNKEFETIFNYGSSSYTMRYEIEEIDDNNINVTYTQDDGKENTNFLTKWKMTSTTKKRLKSFEKYIKQNRNK